MFSLRTLFIVVAIAALGVAAIVSDVYGLMSGFVVVTLGILCWAFLERQMPYWRGLLIFGTVYLVCACVPAFNSVSDALPSTWFDRAAARWEWDEKVSNEPPLEDPFADDPFAPRPRSPFDRRTVQPGDPFEFRETKRMVAHSIVALLFGLVGGLLYAWRMKKGGT
jgi:hypothetical protein